jgi:hypothetical protein
MVEFRAKSPYDNYADEFIRRYYRERTGWRRDEWAHSPLFICGNFGTNLPGILAEPLEKKGKLRWNRRRDGDRDRWQ